MELSSDLISQLVKTTTSEKKTPSESTVYGTIVKYDGSNYVRLDGSELLTPVSTTTDAEEGERVTVLIKDHTATVTGNLSSPSARTDTVKEIGKQVAEFEIIIADKISVEELNATNAKIEKLEAADVTITGKLEANEASIKKLDAEKLSAEAADIKYATIETLNATNATITGKLEVNEAYIQRLDAEKLSADVADIKYAAIADLTATNAVINNLKADVADIDTLIFGSASGGTIQTSFANAVIAQLGNAQIKSAMIESISADKITAGDIITNNVRVMSEDGKLLISDETIQISDSSRVRVQIGKDAAGDYSINIWDASGNLMFSEGGITDDAIKDAIIRNDMVSENANISASKLDINSLFTEINGSTETIKASRIFLDDWNQNLEVSFTTLSECLDDVDDVVSSQGTAISVIQGQISSKVWQQDIDTATDALGKTTETLTSNYSALSQRVDGISTTVSSHTTQIANKADSSEVTSVSNKVTSLESNLSGFKTTVSNTYATKTALSTTDAKAADAAVAAANAQSEVDSLGTRVDSAVATISQNSDSITSLVTRTAVVENKFADYSTTSEVTSMIDQRANSITQTVSNTYATKTALSTTDTKASKAQSDINALEVGGRNLLVNSSFTENLEKWTCSGVTMTELDGETCAHISGELTKTYGASQNIFAKIDPKDLTQEYTFSADVNMKNYVAGTTNPYVQLYFTGSYDNAGTSTWMGATTVSGSQRCDAYNNQGWVRMVWTVKFTKTPIAMTIYMYARDFTGDLYFKNLKLEKGNRATDWTPAPEDVDTDISEVADVASNAQTSADDVADRLTVAESTIQQLANAINMLIVGEDGSTLLSQTEDGWSFNLSSLSSGLSTATDDISTLIEDMNGVENTTTALQQAVADLGVLADYVIITTYNGQPCIELGEAENGFKLRITNTQIQFLADGTIPAWFSNQKMYVEIAEITNELQFGGFVFKLRDNGNMGLMWKGDD